MQARFIIPAIGVGLLVCTSCATISMNVRAYPDPDQPPRDVRTFKTVPVGLCHGNELLERNVLHIVREKLEGKGLLYADAEPDALVAVTCYVGPFDQYIPPTTIYWPVPTTATSTSTVSGSVAGTSVYGSGTTTTSGTRYVPITRPGYTVTQYYRHVSVLFARISGTREAPKVDTVWSGEVESSGSNSDLLIVAPWLVDQLLGEFPVRTGRPAARRVKMSSPPGKRR